jgi:chemotaxis protein CheD
VSAPLSSHALSTCEVDGGSGRLVVGIGELAVSDRPSDVIVTHALGSCIAVCVFDPERHVAGMLHFLLPEARINPQRAAEQPAAFADTGIPLLFQAVYQLGAQKTRCRVCLVGGAEVAAPTAAGPCAFNIGRRNQLAAKNTLWRNGVLIDQEDTGGRTIRTVRLWVADGRLQVSAGRETLYQL